MTPPEAPVPHVPRNRPRTLRGVSPWASPSAPFWILAVTVSLVGLHAALDPVWDADLWWILRAGRDLLADGSIPHVNRYSFTEPGHPWVMHEWLTGAVYALLVRVGGLGALALVRIIALAVTALAAFTRAARDARPLTAALCVSLALALYGSRFGSPRPVGMVIALASVMTTVALDARSGPLPALLLGALSLVWTNAHGSFPLGVVITLVGCGIPANRRFRILGVVLATAATFANPYGTALHRLALRYVFGRPTDAIALVHTRILEWWPLARAPLRVASLPELLIALALVIVWVLSLRDPRWRPRAVLGLLLSGMAWQHNRHLHLAGMLGLPLAAGPIDAWLGGLPVAGAVRKGCAALAAATVVTLALWLVALRTRSQGRWTDPTHDDEDLAHMVDGLPSRARVYTSLPYTGYVLGLGRPVYWDTRNDAYDRDVLGEGMDISDGVMDPAAADTALRRRGTTDAVVPCEDRVARSLVRWRVTRSLGRFCLYEPVH